ADHSGHGVRRPEHHPPSRSNRVRRRVRDKPATQRRRSPGRRETEASSGGRNRAEKHPIPIHPSGPRRNSVRYPVNAGLKHRSCHWLLSRPCRAWVLSVSSNLFRGNFPRAQLSCLNFLYCFGPPRLPLDDIKSATFETLKGRGVMSEGPAGPCYNVHVVRHCPHLLFAFIWSCDIEEDVRAVHGVRPSSALPTPT